MSFTDFFHVNLEFIINQNSNGSCFNFKCASTAVVCWFLQVSPWDKREEAFKKKLEFSVGNSDYLALLQAYKVRNKNSQYSLCIYDKFSEAEFVINTLRDFHYLGMVPIFKRKLSNKLQLLQTKLPIRKCSSGKLNFKMLILKVSYQMVLFTVLFLYFLSIPIYIPHSFLSSRIRFYYKDLNIHFLEKPVLPKHILGQLCVCFRVVSYVILLLTGRLTWKSRPYIMV